MIGMYSVFKSKTRYKNLRDCNMSLHLHKYTLYIYIHICIKILKSFPVQLGFLFVLKYSGTNSVLKIISLNLFAWPNLSDVITWLTWRDALCTTWYAGCVFNQMFSCLALMARTPGLFSKITYFNLVLQEKRFSMFVIF